MIRVGSYLLNSVLINSRLVFDDSTSIQVGSWNLHRFDLNPSQFEIRLFQLEFKSILGLVSSLSFKDSVSLNPTKTNIMDFTWCDVVDFDDFLEI